MKMLTLIAITMLISLSCNSINNINTYITVNYEKYFETTVLPVKGIVMVAHGLNMIPSKMGDNNTDGTLVKLFLDEGYHIYRVILPGHGGAIEEMQNVNSQDWLNSALMQYQETVKIAHEKRIPIYLAAFSLGGLVYKNLIHAEKDVKFDGVILFAPAISIKRSARLVSSGLNNDPLVPVFHDLVLYNFQ